VPAGTRWLSVEGVGASRRELAEHLDASVRVQSDLEVAERLGLARDLAEGHHGDLEATTRCWHEWQPEERPFLVRAGAVGTGRCRRRRRRAARRPRRRRPGRRSL